MKMKTLSLLALGLAFLAAAPGLARAEENAEKQGKPVLIDLYAEWCSACKQQKKILDQFETKYGDAVTVKYVDVEQDGEMAKKYNIRVIPTLVFESPKGELLYRNEGVLNEEALVNVFHQAGYMIEPKN